MTELVPFSYGPIRSDEFRVIQILPGKGRLKARLHVSSLESPMRYDFLSTIWGVTQRSQHFIELEGQSFGVSQHIHGFLHEIRDSLHSQTLWIDFFCINQGDSSEKKNQVMLMMPEIQRKARRTICWLGEASSWSAPAVQLILDLSQLPWTTEQNDSAPLSSDPSRSGSKVDAAALACFESKTKQVTQAAWDALNQFLSNPYFERYISFYHTGDIQ